MVLKKRKRLSGATDGKKAGGQRASASAPEPRDHLDGNLDSDDDDLSSDAGAAKPPSDDDEELLETPDEKRVRLAKEYLDTLGADRPKEAVQEQLDRDMDEKAKRVRIQVEDVEFGKPMMFKQGHKAACTGVCLSSDDSVAWSTGKDCSVVRWDVESGSKDRFKGGRNCFDSGAHFEKALAICLIESRGLAASVGVDRLVRLWDARAPAHSACQSSLSGHTGPVTAVVAEADGHQLFTASTDKSVRIWDMRTKRCVDTLFGHTSGVSTMDTYAKARVLTGGVDKSVRLWKVDKETHLMFNKHTYPVDAVTMADHDRFLSGSQDGSIFLWSHASKKPLAQASLGSSRWVTALQAVRGGNVAFSGGVDGVLRSWRFGRGVGGSSDDKALTLTEAASPLELPGCINAIAVGRRVLACALGKEHRLGSWQYDKSQKNGVMIIPLSYAEKR